MDCKVLLNVRWKKGGLTVWWFGHDVPVEDLNGHWGSPMPSFYESYEPVREKPLRSKTERWMKPD